VGGSESFDLVKGYLGKVVRVVVDRPLGSQHPKHDFTYEANYGYVPETKAPDGEEIDAYFLGVDRPVSEGIGICLALVHRLDDNDDKLVVVPAGTNLGDEEIERAIHFQEEFFKHEIVRGS